jgi:hypothetical protein
VPPARPKAHHQKPTPLRHNRIAIRVVPCACTLSVVTLSAVQTWHLVLTECNCTTRAALSKVACDARLTAALPYTACTGTLRSRGRPIRPPMNTQMDGQSRKRNQQASPWPAGTGILRATSEATTHTITSQHVLSAWCPRVCVYPVVPYPVRVDGTVRT